MLIINLVVKKNLKDLIQIAEEWCSVATPEEYYDKKKVLNILKNYKKEHDIETIQE